MHIKVKNLRTITWLTLFITLIVCVLSLNPQSTSATATTIAMPNVPLPASVTTHGSGAFTVSNFNCPYYNNDPNSTALSAVTFDQEEYETGSIPKIKDGYQTQPCYNTSATGSDESLYVVQVGAAPTYRYRVTAERNGVSLWQQYFTPQELNPSCSNQYARVHSITLGKDNNLLAVLVWPYHSPSCPEKETFVSIDSGSGTINFNVALPGTGTSQRESQMKLVRPYDSGVAVLNGNTVYYFDYGGTLNVNATFTPPLSGMYTSQMKVVPSSGRTFLVMENSSSTKKLYYKDPSSTSATEILLPSGRTFVEIFATPAGGYVETWRIPSTPTFGFTYFNSSGEQLYDKTLSNEAGAIVSSSVITADDLAIDDDGNVLVRRTINNITGDNDRNVIIDSFDTNGTSTRIFNTSSLGTSGQDSFNKSGGYLEEGLDVSALYMVICHVTGSFTSSCTSNSTLVKIDRSGGFDIARANVFSALSSKLNYVALGDSFASGQGIPSFLAPSGSNGCNRSSAAYPVWLGRTETSVNLRAFVACSGATTSDVEIGKHGEVSQLASLSETTEIISLTIGGNDIGFSTFAEQCVFFTCSSDSTPYITALHIINANLYTHLTGLFEEIDERSPDAEVYVVGYPQIAPESGISCAFLTDSEKNATRNLVSALNSKIAETVADFSPEFVFVDPTNEESPFTGHEYCRDQSYFISPDALHPEYSFHPNALGQSAYASILQEAILNN